MTASAETSLVTVLVVLGVLGLLLCIAVYLWYALALSRLFPRIGGEGWKGWVPILNESEILARGGVPAWSVVFYFIPLVQIYGLYLKIVATHRINAMYGRGAGMTVLAILLPPVWASVLAWGAAPYPEGDRLAAMQPAPRRTAPAAAAPARDASGYTIPALVPSGSIPVSAPPLIFPDYAPPQPAEPRSFAPPPAPVDAHPTTGIMAAMGGDPPESPQVPDELPVPEAQRVVRSVPPTFRDEQNQVADAPMPTIRPAPDLSLPAAPASDPSIQMMEPAVSPDAGLAADVDKTVVTPRQTDDDLEATVVVARKRGVRRVLVLDDGRRFPLSGASVVIGRNPVGEPGEQRLAVSDTTRTLSKTHARLVVLEDEWRLTDLNATNGVVVVADDGAEMLLDPGESVVGTGRFILGEVGMHVVAERDS